MKRRDFLITTIAAANTLWLPYACQPKKPTNPQKKGQRGLSHNTATKKPSSRKRVPAAEIASITGISMSRLPANGNTSKCINASR